MSRNIDLSGIKSIRKRLQALKSISNDDIAMAIADKGKAIAQSRVGGSITITTESLGNGKARLNATGDQISFIEFGTGVKGKGTYRGELPTEDISFTSRGLDFTTSGWIYNYYATFFSPPTALSDKRVKDFQGFSAKAPIWKTANELENGKALQAVKELMKERGVW